MNSDDCGRCGSALSTPALLCSDCRQWLDEQPAIGDDEAVEAGQFLPQPIPSGERARVAMVAGGVLHLFLLLPLSMLYIDVFDDKVNRGLQAVPLAAVTTVWFCFTLTVPLLVIALLIARSRLRLGAWIGCLGVLALGLPIWAMSLQSHPPHTVIFARMRSLPLSLEGQFTAAAVLQLFAFIGCAAALYFARLRRERIEALGQDLQRLR